MLPIAQTDPTRFIFEALCRAEQFCHRAELRCRKQPNQAVFDFEATPFDSNSVHPTEACAEHSGRFFEAWLSYPMIVQKCVPDEQTLARDRQHHWRTAFAGKRWRPRYPLPSQHLCRARLGFSRQCQSNIDNHIPQRNPSIREPCLENLGRTLPADVPQTPRGRWRGKR
ncbi:hypothetical protein CA85_25010 [Allorhodopirellula solitaria]|uniref:Uncharacterized protein n=1 Tax=Allorhodopirellula solitaria TaxID=2527987 RepID=A0A5C5XT31_9BACT|nr:hypothetical protein CA85_25010 [Allorhodopirellula solitaria]